MQYLKLKSQLLLLFLFSVFGALQQCNFLAPQQNYRLIPELFTQNNGN